MITVLLTTYNCAPYLRQSIRSILNQSCKDFEFLIIDDGSTDATEKIVDQFKDPRIRFIKREHFGRSAALNYGLNNASSNTIALMDADDISHPERLETQLNVYDFGYSSISSTWSLYFKNQRFVYSVKTPDSDQLLKRKLLLHSFICNPSVIYNRNFILEKNGYNEEINTFEDYDLWLRIKNDAVFQVVPEYLLYIRIRSNSLSRTESPVKRNIIYQIQKDYLKNDKEWNSMTENQKRNIEGWQAFFYGTKTMARNTWLTDGLKIILKPKKLMALLVTFLPNFVFFWFREGRFRLRVYFFIEKLYSKKSHLAKKVFRKINEPNIFPEKT